MAEKLKDKVLKFGTAGLLMLSSSCGFYRIPAEVLNQFNIPKKFENYLSNKVNLELTVEAKGMVFSVYIYDTDKDGRNDVVEVISPLSTSPMFYLFDINGDGDFEDDGETILDEYMDGLNGNEKITSLPLSEEGFI